MPIVQIDGFWMTGFELGVRIIRLDKPQPCCDRKRFDNGCGTVEPGAIAPTVAP
ncbi:hypothetical protein ACQ4M4_24460 [Leptolyngbya sp. AN02str]|uniref:hypothetical protein n=1 Tax=Leptolyngbya sp. AN02str TaxID=3423363 RepID=UPI003D321292